MPSPFAQFPKKASSTRKGVSKKSAKLRLFAPALAMIITLAGAGVATMLAQKSQENRGQAAGCNPNVDQPRCSDNDGYWWTCQDPGKKGNWSYQKGGVCNESIANPQPANTSSWNADGSCIENRNICRGGKQLRCTGGQYVADGNNCGGNLQPLPGNNCASSDHTCTDGKYFVCECKDNNCSWQRYTDWDSSCTNDYFEWGAGGGSGSTQGGSSPQQECRQEKISELYVRTSSSGGTNWGQWVGPNTTVSVGTGSLTSFSAWTDATATTKQYAVRGGQLWIRTYGRDMKWSEWSELTNPTGAKGIGSLTSFSTHFFNSASLNGIVRQYAVKGGQLWVRNSTSTPGAQLTTWTEWAGPNKAVDTIGTGTLTGFSSYEFTKNRVYENKQYAVKGGQLWVRTSNNNANWTAWAGPNTAADAAGGSGTLMSFATIQEGTEFKQYAVKEKTIDTCAIPAPQP